ncbi:MAG: FeoB-associated Cys-rich membrane protein [Saccharofermentanales bacterium]
MIILAVVNVADVTVVLIILVLSFFALRTLMRSKKSGGCAGCSGCIHQQECQKSGIWTHKESSGCRTTPTHDPATNVCVHKRSFSVHQNESNSTRRIESIDGSTTCAHTHKKLSERIQS